MRTILSFIDRGLKHADRKRMAMRVPKRPEK